MSDSSQQILLELPAPLLKKLGNAPAKKILELVEKFVEAKSTEIRNISSSQTPKTKKDNDKT